MWSRSRSQLIRRRASDEIRRGADLVGVPGDDRLTATRASG
ncbi:hypothetical protein DB30_01410 [Enhygromyxa salina]|uniref:Uncharacterized protein n=1 Tax=Enhygromyxa salina TaxID=215803 RepID=A0A0C2D568_9BACT|nr:hypothetical protein DB30_01410 [Enhygromyxa salina]